MTSPTHIFEKSLSFESIVSSRKGLVRSTTIGEMEHPRDTLRLRSHNTKVQSDSQGPDVSQNEIAPANDAANEMCTVKSEDTYQKSASSEDNLTGSGLSSSKTPLRDFLTSKIKKNLPYYWSSEKTTSEHPTYEASHSTPKAESSATKNRENLQSFSKSMGEEEFEHFRKSTCDHQALLEVQRSLEAHNGALSRENEDLKFHLSQQTGFFSANMEALKQEASSYKNKLSDADQLLAKTQSELEECKQAKNKTITALANLQKVDSLKFDDAFFRKSVGDLRFLVKNWATAQHILLPSALGQSGTSEFRFLEETTPVYQNYITSSKNLALLLQASVWKWLVLILERDWWVGSKPSQRNATSNVQLAAGYINLKEQLRKGKSPKEFSVEYNEWRSSTARLVADVIDQRRIDKSAEGITQHIINIWKPVTHRDSQMDFGGLNHILKHAFTLARQLATQRAFFQFECSGPSHNGKLVEVNPDLMSTAEGLEDEELGDSTLVVVFSLAPGLRKYGTSDGARLSSETLLLVKNDVEPMLLSPIV